VFVPLAVGLPLMAAAPAYYYHAFNQWSARSGGIAPGWVERDEGKQPRWSDSGLEWVDVFNKGQSPAQLVWATSTQYLLGWRWDRTAPDPPDNSTPTTWTRTPLAAAMGVVGLAAALGALWPPRRPPAASPEAAPPQPWWRTAWWLAAWIIVPTYGVFYVRSTPGFASPIGWMSSVWGWLLALPVAIAAVAWLRRGETIKNRLKRFAQLLAIAGGLLIACGLCYLAWTYALTRVSADDVSKVWRSIWMPRYVAVVWPAFAIAVVLLLHRVPGRYLRHTALGFLLAFNVVQTIAMLVIDTQPPLDRIAADIDAAKPPEGEASGTRTFLMLSKGQPLRTHPWLDHRGLRYYLCVLNRLRPGPEAFSSDEFDRPFRMRPATREAIERELKSSPGVQRVIVWDRLDERSTPVTDRTVLDAAGPGWSLAEQTVSRRRQGVTWREVMVLRRRVFVRQAATHND
jgi:hypothetical protein